MNAFCAYMFMHIYVYIYNYICIINNFLYNMYHTYYKENCAQLFIHFE